MVRCYTEQRAVAGDGIWQFALAQRASTNLAEFVRLLHQPNETMSPQANFGCPLSLLMVPAFGLVGSDGKVIQPLLPVDVCGDALPNVLTAFSGLPWKTEAEAKLNQLQTQAEINTGCPSAYKYLPALKVDTSTGSPIPWSQVRQIAAFPINQVCLFRLDGAATAADPVPAGTFVAGALLTTAQGGALQTAISGASTAGSAAPACSVRATRFAMIGSQKQGLNYLVELDGCRRLMFPNSYFATAPAGLYSALAQVGIK